MQKPPRNRPSKFGVSKYRSRLDKRHLCAQNITDSCALIKFGQVFLAFCDYDHKYFLEMPLQISGLFWFPSNSREKYILLLVLHCNTSYSLLSCSLIPLTHQKSSTTTAVLFRFETLRQTRVACLFAWPTTNNQHAISYWLRRVYEDLPAVVKTGDFYNTVKSIGHTSRKKSVNTWEFRKPQWS